MDYGCWEWTACKHKDGYGKFRLPDCVVIAHRFIYEYFHDGIDPNQTIDHLCRNRTCVNPKHLQQISRGENVLLGNTIASWNSRKTHCPQGHEYSGNNLYLYTNGNRRCRVCNRLHYEKHTQILVHSLTTIA